MNKLAVFVAAAGVVALVGSAGAQLTKTVQGEQVTATATVEAIDRTNREVTVKKADGTYDVFYVPESIKRFDTLKVGDRLTATYYENIVLQLKAPGQKDVNTPTQTAVTAAPDKSALTAARQRTITATIAAIDNKVPSITFTGPNNWKYSTRVKDRDALAKVKVGDKLDITWTHAMVVSITEGK